MRNIYNKLDKILEQSMALLAIALNRDATDVGLAVHEREDIRQLLAEYKARK